MMKKFSSILSPSLTGRRSFAFSSSTEDISFLKMVENYFDKAGRHTNIKADKLNFYKKPENCVKFNLTLVRGSIIPYSDDGSI